MKLQLRPALPPDGEFLLQVYASTRAAEMALVDWTEEQKRAFIEMQFEAQRTWYQQLHPNIVNQIIQRDGMDVGRLITDRDDNEIAVIDLALLPEHRNAGIGTTLLRDLMAEATQTRKRVRLHVEFFNPALHLYERLGFTKIGEQSIYFEMEWRATP